jgi:hypothetical protein
MAAQNLFQSYLQPVRTVADYEGDLQQQDMRKMQLQSAAQNNAMAGLVQQQRAQAMQRNALVQAAQRAAAQQAGGDEGAYAKNLRLSGFPELIDPAEKVDKAATERGKAQSENAKRDTETENNVIAMWRDMIGNAVDQQQAAQMFTAMRSDPRIANTPVAKVPLELGLRSLAEKPLDQWKKEFALGATKYVEMNKPTYQQQNLGGTMQTLALPGLGGAPTVAAAAPITQSADNKANNDRMAADALASRLQSAAQFNQRFKLEAGTATADLGGPDQSNLVKKFGRASPGYRWKSDGSQEAIPGGPADRKNTDAGIREQRQREASVAQADRVLAKVDQALDKVGITTAGPGSVLSGLPGTDARNLDSTLQTIKANLGFAELQAMRDASPTGGALGAIAVQELVALQATVASLDQGQSPAQLRKSLGDIKRHYTNWKNAVEGKEGKPPATPPAPSAVQSGTDLGGGFRVK